MSTLKVFIKEYSEEMNKNFAPEKIDITRQVEFSVKAGYDFCQKEYEEKLRWIPVEEKLPERIKKQPYISHVVQVKSITYAEPLCAYYNHDHCVWLSYPFGFSAKLLTVTHWRSFL